MSTASPSRPTASSRSSLDADRPLVDWKRNLAALWLAEFLAIFGFSFAFPFLPIFLNHDLGVHAGRDLDIWTAAAGSASGLALAFLSPVWGIMGDRFGRKPMLMRAMAGGALTVGLIYFAQNPYELVILRFLQGATSGTIAAATALVAVETPRSRVGWALGVLTSSVAVGGAIGPVIGGLAGAAFGLRVVFLVGGLLLFLGMIPVFVIVKESPLRKRDRSQPSTMATLKEKPGVLRAIGVLIAAQGLVTVVGASSQQLVVLKLLEVVSQTTASAVTGVAFGLSGAANAIAAVGYTQVSSRIGYVMTTSVSALLLAAAIGLIAVSPAISIIVGAVAVTGLLNGVVVPATASMIGLECPSTIQSTVFGFNSSAVALGFFAGPLIAGGVAAGASVSIGLGVSAILAVVLGILLAVGAREPVRE